MLLELVLRRLVELIDAVAFDVEFPAVIDAAQPAFLVAPENSDTRRCGQNSSTRPMRPSLSRNATRSSPSSLTRTGGQSGSAISHDRQAGIQYRRIALPIGVPGPTRVISSFSFGGSIGDFLLGSCAGKFE